MTEKIYMKGLGFLLRNHLVAFQKGYTTLTSRQFSISAWTIHQNWFLGAHFLTAFQKILAIRDYLYISEKEMNNKYGEFYYFLGSFVKILWFWQVKPFLNIKVPLFWVKLWNMSLWVGYSYPKLPLFKFEWSLVLRNWRLGPCGPLT